MSCSPFRSQRESPRETFLSGRFLEPLPKLSSRGMQALFQKLARVFLAGAIVGLPTIARSLDGTNATNGKNGTNALDFVLGQAPAQFAGNVEREVADLRAGGDDKKRYFLNRPAAEKPRDGWRALFVLPGGPGSADFQPFVSTSHGTPFLRTTW